MTPLIRPYAPADKPEILALSLRAWEPVFEKMQSAVPDYVFKAFYPHGWWIRQSADIERLLEAEGEQILVAVDGKAILGWIGVRVHPEDRMGEVHILAVDPAQQRSGVASALLDAALAAMRAAGMCIVWWRQATTLATRRRGLPTKA